MWRELLRRLGIWLEGRPMVSKIGEEQAGPYGPAIREKEGEAKEGFLELLKPGPAPVGPDYPFFRPGIFTPNPKAWEGQGEFMQNFEGSKGGGNSTDMAWDSPGKDRIEQLAARVLGATQSEDGYGREKRPFYFG
jgi:hypothetical protein